MPWCPKCKNEYVAGITACADCKCNLIDSLEEIEPEAGIEEQLPLQRETAEKERAQDEQLSEQTQDEQLSEQKHAVMFQGSHVYQKSSEKAEDFKSSAYVLLLVGGGGLLLLLLVLTGLLPISLYGMNRYLIGGVMGAMFILFIVMGVLSLRSSKTLLGRAVKEDELTKEILNWCGKNLTKETMEEIFKEDAKLPEEEKYFRRALYMRERISNQFLNLDESYLEQLVDDYYQEIWGSV